MDPKFLSVIELKVSREKNLGSPKPFALITCFFLAIYAFLFLDFFIIPWWAYFVLLLFGFIIDLFYLRRQREHTFVSLKQSQKKRFKLFYYLKDQQYEIDVEEYAFWWSYDFSAESSNKYENSSGTGADGSLESTGTENGIILHLYLFDKDQKGIHFYRIQRFYEELPLGWEYSINEPEVQATFECHKLEELLRKVQLSPIPWRF